MQPSIHRPAFRYYAVTVEDMMMTADERNIHHLFDTIRQAWSSGDANLFASCFTEDSDYINFQGEHLEGKEANKEAHQKMFNSFLKNSTLLGDIQKIKFISDEVAVVHCLTGIKAQWQRVVSKNKINTNVVVKQNGEWKISAFHNTQIKKPGLIDRIAAFFK